jgi:hypothetical protein
VALIIHLPCERDFRLQPYCLRFKAATDGTQEDSRRHEVCQNVFHFLFSFRPLGFFISYRERRGRMHCLCQTVIAENKGFTRGRRSLLNLQVNPVIER